MAVNQKHSEFTYKRIADASVPICNTGAAADKVKPYFCKKYGEPTGSPRRGAPYQNRTDNCPLGERFGLKNWLELKHENS